MDRPRFLFGINAKHIALGKFVGTVSLGLLTGLSYTTTLLTLPSLQLLPSATTASNTTHHLRTSTSSTTTYLCQLATLSFAFTYIISPPRRKHPFLIYAGLTALIPLGLDAWNESFPPLTTPSSGKADDGGRISMRDMSMAAGGRGVGGRKSSSHSSGSDEEWEVDASGMRGGSGKDSGEEDEKMNGESVREGMRSWGQGMAARGILWAVGFAIAVVGIWGDGA